MNSTETSSELSLLLWFLFRLSQKPVLGCLPVDDVPDILDIRSLAVEVLFQVSSVPGEREQQ